MEVLVDLIELSKYEEVTEVLGLDGVSVYRVRVPKHPFCYVLRDKDDSSNVLASFPRYLFDDKARLLYFTDLKDGTIKVYCEYNRKIYDAGNMITENDFIESQDVVSICKLYEKPLTTKNTSMENMILIQHGVSKIVDISKMVLKKDDDGIFYLENTHTLESIYFHENGKPIIDTPTIPKKEYKRG